MTKPRSCGDGQKRRKSSLACQALVIALQHWMIPNLGWETDYLEKQQEDLRKRGNEQSNQQHSDNILLDDESIAKMDQELFDLCSGETIESLLPSRFEIQVCMLLIEIAFLNNTVINGLFRLMNFNLKTRSLRSQIPS
jgi:hypothetical protein